MMQLQPGTTLGGRYVLDSLLAVGGMGEVWRATDSELDRAVAVKVLKDGSQDNEVFLKRFRNEAKNAAGLMHPNIAQVYDYGDQDRTAFLVMELVDGVPMSTILERERTISERRLVKMLVYTCRGLQVAHDAGIIHRDIKPGNLMVTNAAPGVRVLDFGVSKLLDAENAELSRAGQVVGTPQYMAPEQILPRGKLTGACDVYALGQVLYEMLVGEPCFTGKTVRDVLQAQVSDAPVSIRSRAGSGMVPDDLAGLIARCLEKAPEARPSADSLAAALRVIADELGAPPLEHLGPPRHLLADARDLDFGAATVRATAGHVAPVSAGRRSRQDA